MSAISLARSRRAARGQAGVGTIEVLIAMLILGITVGGIATASITAGGVGKDANQEARLNVLMTAFAEAVKAMPYHVCPDADVYQDEFRASEGNLSPGAVALTDTANTDFAIEVEAGPECPLDSGFQSIRLTVRIDGDELQRQIIKRTDDVGAEPLNFCIMSPVPGEGNCPDTDPNDGLDEGYDAALQRSEVGDTLVVWGLRAAGRSNIYQYQWWCDGQWHADDPESEPPRSPDFTTDSVIDTLPECQYAAPTGVVRQRIALRVIEADTNRVGTTSALFTLPPTPTGHQPPIARIAQLNPIACTDVAPTLCLEGTTVTVESDGDEQLDADIIQWEWNFGDGTPTVLCRRDGATDPDGLRCITQEHTFVGARPNGAPYQVRLWVTDNFGMRSAPATHQVLISGEPIVRPTINLNSGLTGSPPWGISPQAVNFNATGSHMDGYPTGTGAAAGIQNYEWDYGVPVDQVPEALRSGPNLAQPTFTYNVTVRTTFDITLTITDLNGTQNTATMTVTVEPLLWPINMRNNGMRQSDILLFRNARFDFQWTNVPAMPGDTMQTQIEIRSAGGGFCGFVNLSANPRIFTVASNAPGSVQSYRANFSSSPAGRNGICSLDTYSFRSRTVRTTPGGAVFYSVWSPPSALNPEFF